jgi:hypothetical protein
VPALKMLQLNHLIKKFFALCNKMIYTFFSAVVLYIQIYLLPTTPQYLHMLLHISVELLSHHQGDIPFRHMQLAACHRMVKYMYILPFYDMLQAAYVYRG